MTKANCVGLCMYNISVYYLYGLRCDESYPAYVTTSSYPTESDYIRHNSVEIINTRTSYLKRTLTYPVQHTSTCHRQSSHPKSSGK